MKLELSEKEYLLLAHTIIRRMMDIIHENKNTSKPEDLIRNDELDALRKFYGKLAAAL